MTGNPWDDRFGGDTYVYGTEPNDFLRAEAARIPRGRVLALAEGEGRNAVFLAGLGHDVTAVDLSREGLRKTEKLAADRGVAVTTVHADLATYEPDRGAYQGVIAIFAHLPAPVRHAAYARAAAALAPGGVMIVESYRPEQVALGTGGPKDLALLPTLDDLRDDLAGLDLVVARAVVRDVVEGTLHTGRAATVQVVAVRPAAG